MIQLQPRQSGKGWCSGEQRRYSYTTGSQEKGAFSGEQKIYSYTTDRHEKGGVLGNREDTVTPPTVRRRVVFWRKEKIQLQYRQSGKGWCSGEQRRYSYNTDSQEKGGVLGNISNTVTIPTVRRRVVFWRTEKIQLHHRQSGEGWYSGEQRRYSYNTDSQEKGGVLGTERIELQHRQSGEGWCSGEQSRYTYTTDSQEKGGVLGSREDTVTTLILRRRVVFWGTY